MVGVGALGWAVVAACGGEKELAPGETPKMAEGKPRYGGRQQEVTSAVFDGLDPHLSVAAATGYFPRIYNVLVKQSSLKPDFIFHDLAEEFEVPEPGATEWIFQIRPGVRIAPNQLGIPERDMDAEDARVSFERIEGLPEAPGCAFVCKWFASHEAPNPQTYIIRTPKPYAWFLPQIGGAGGAGFGPTIPPRELIQQHPDRMRETGVGAGPFFVRPGGYAESQRLILDKNPNYYRRDPANNNAQLPYIDGFDVKVVPDIAAVRAAFISRQANVYITTSKQEAEELLNAYDVRAGDPIPGNAFIAFTMNVTREPWDDPKIRKAALYAINRQEYIDRVYRGDARVNGLVPWALGAYALPDEELEQLQPFSAERSKQLIQEAGYSLPLRIKVVYPAGGFLDLDKHLAIWLVQMREAGFEVEQEVQDLGVWIENMTKKNYDASLHPNLAAETPEFPLDFHHSQGPAASGIYSNGLQDAEVDAAIEATKELTDPEGLVSSIHEVQRLIYERGPVHLPIVSPFSRPLYWNFVKNFPQGLGNAGLLVNTWWLDL